MTHPINPTIPLFHVIFLQRGNPDNMPYHQRKRMYGNDRGDYNKRKRTDMITKGKNDNGDLIVLDEVSSSDQMEDGDGKKISEKVKKLIFHYNDSNLNRHQKYNLNEFEILLFTKVEIWPHYNLQKCIKNEFGNFWSL